MRIPLTQIDPHALLRDRTILDPDALEELQRSIATAGLRTPVEVYETDTGYALLSGYRRLMAVKRLHDLTSAPQWAEIDAVLRTPADTQAALAAMVEENEIRQNLSPWERAAIATACVTAGTFATLDEALRTLYPHASRQKRARLRAVAEVVEALDGQLTDPETLSESRLLRLSAVLRLGWGSLIEAALSPVRGRPAPVQWDTLSPLLTEAETLAAEGRPTTPNRPKRLLRPRCGLMIRREKTRAGYLLHVTGSSATDAVVEEVLEEIERMFGT